MPAPALVAAGLLALGLVLAVEALRRVAGRWWRHVVAVWRARRAGGGERRAEEILARRGWRVVERQPRRVMTIEVDGAPRDVDLRADLLVARRGRLMIAEVKTGERAPRLSNRDTRRQLLEYRVAWAEVDGVLLVDADADRVREVVFPVRGGAGRALEAVLAGVAVGAMAAAGAIWLVWGQAG